MEATKKQIEYIINLAEAAGAENGRHWLCDHLGIGLSQRPSRSLTARQASELIQRLKSGDLEIAA